jgi:hypothetical protein
VRYYALRSTDGGATWEQVKMGTYKRQPYCVNTGCRKDHFGGMSNVDDDGNGTLVYTMAGSEVEGDGQVVYVRTSTDGGQTWTAPQAISPEMRGSRRVIASFPIVESSGDAGDFRLAWMDDYKGLKNWNTWYVASSDGGQTWSDSERISDAISGAGYKDKGGYDADYGDYMGMAVMSDGRTIATWGEAYSYWGPGGTWINTQPICPTSAPQPRAC